MKAHRRMEKSTMIYAGIIIIGQEKKHTIYIIQKEQEWHRQKEWLKLLLITFLKKKTTPSSTIPSVTIFFSGSPISKDRFLIDRASPQFSCAEFL